MNAYKLPRPFVVRKEADPCKTTQFPLVRSSPKPSLATFQFVKHLNPLQRSQFWT